MMGQELSGKFLLRISPRLHAALKRRAAEQSLSLNEYCTRLLETAVKKAPVSTESVSEPAATWIQNDKKIFDQHLLGVLLFGSSARGKNRAESDTDLLVVLERGEALTRELYRRWDEQFSGSTVNPHIVHLPSDLNGAGSLWFEVALEGIILYERDGAVSRFLTRIRKAIASHQLERRTLHGQPYWIRRGRGLEHAE